MPKVLTRLDRFTALAFGSFGAAGCWAVLEALVPAGHRPEVDWWVVLLFAALVTASENLAVKFPSRVTVSPQLILVMAAIVALDHHGVVLGSLIIGGSRGLVGRAFRSRRFVLIIYNVGQMALSAGAAGAAYHVVSRTGAPVATVYGVTLAVYAAVNFGLVVGAAGIRSGTPLRAIVVSLRTTMLIDAVFGVLGLLLGDLYREVGPIALVAVGAPAIAAHSVFTSAVRFRRAYHRLDLLYSFTRRIERSRDRPDVVVAVLDQFRSLLDVGVAELVARGPTGWRKTRLGPEAPPTVRDFARPDILLTAAARGPALSDDATPELQSMLAIDGISRAMLTPMLLDGDLIGVIIVANPDDDRRFDAEDLKLLETLANHAAVSVEHARLLDQMRFDASHDPLTGLPNRNRFNELVDRAGRCAVLLVDLDRFKDINDTLGHHHGDLLLRSVGVRISEELGHKGIVARLGGDEFGVLLPHTAGGDAAQAAVSLLAALERPFEVGELHLEITASIGVTATGPDDTDEPDEVGKLLQQADVAMYLAKTAHSGWEMYTPERDHYSPRRLALAGELRQAIDHGDLEVHYQPKADLRTGRILGFEALARWRHPHFGLLSPDVFIPLAEHVGLIRPLTLMVLDSAIDELHRLHDRGFPVGVAVNLSVRSVLDVNLPDLVADVLARHGMAAADLTLEITESSVMTDPARTIGILGRLSQLGVAISVDDFGTGYSSLSYLKRLPVSEVKVDRTFVSGLLNDDSDAAIVRSTIDLARNLGLRVVAEGVEDRATWAALAALGCDQAQGYFVSPPLAPAALNLWVERTNLVIDPSV